jgi:magnesium-transporting ATPase (P-type)
MIQQTVVSGLVMGLLGVRSVVLAGPRERGRDRSARNLLLLLMVLLQNVHVFNCRSEYVSAFKVPLRRNYVLVFGVLAAQGIHILAMQVPFMQNLLRVEPISLQEWGSAAVAGAADPVDHGVFKAVRSRGSREAAVRQGKG